MGNVLIPQNVLVKRRVGTLYTTLKGFVLESGVYGFPDSVTE